ncbi:MAG: DUF1272 domain-containing protein [Alphaproteobacteria bacterium]|nr:DUF1272 domain-containing protein [Alphaproteobacteria bacterium]
MLELRPNCERCDRDLAADAPGAFICSFECTFCAECANGDLNGRCPNCGGALCPRPPRAAALFEKFPPSAKRVLRGAKAAGAG